MSTISTTLDKHLKKQKPKLWHLEYLDQILGSINKVHIDKVKEIRNSIELTLLSNPESENEVVSYLSNVNNNLNLIGRKKADLVRNEVKLVTQ